MSKLTRAFIALAAFMAFAVLPATASATNNPRLTAPTGTVLGHSAISATNVGDPVMTDPETNVLIECATASMSGTLTKNDHTGVEVDITAAEFKGNTLVKDHGIHCRGSAGPTLVTTNVENGLPYCLRSTPTMSTNTFEVRGGACGNEPREIRFVLHITTGLGTITCNYGRTAGLSGTYTTHPKDAVLTIGHQHFERKTGSSFLCPAAGYLDMSFTLTSGGNTVYIGDVT